VLVDTEPLYFEATRDALAELGVALPYPEYLTDMAHGRTAWDRARAAGLDETVVAAGRDARNRRYQQLLCERTIEIPGVEDVLAALAPRYAMAIVTTAKRPDFELIHRGRTIVSYMEFVLVRGDYARAKPAPDPYLQALARFDAVAAEAVVVEDSERGLRSARAAGIDCVVVESAFVNGQDFAAATARIGSLAELPALLETL
jgi:HAD superfamily hydrolase (TIGR01509 family)